MVQEVHQRCTVQLNANQFKYRMGSNSRGGLNFMVFKGTCVITKIYWYKSLLMVTHVQLYNVFLYTFQRLVTLKQPECQRRQQRINQRHRTNNNTGIHQRNKVHHRLCTIAKCPNKAKSL